MGTITVEDAIIKATELTAEKIIGYINDSEDNIVYVQNEEPLNAPEGAVWIDMDEEGISVSNHTHGVVTETENGFMSAELLKNISKSIRELGDSDVSIDNKITSIEQKVGNKSVSAQISDALEGYSSGKTLDEHFAQEEIILTQLQYGDNLPDAGTPGRLFFRKVTV